MDENRSTVLLIKNVLDRAVYFILQIRYDGGDYNPERYKVEPYQTLALDLRRIRDEQKPDIRGGVMPPTAGSGQLIWFEEVQGSLLGRAEITDLAVGAASSFSCGVWCGIVHDSAWMSPSSGNDMIGEAGVFFTPLERRKDPCTGIFYGPYNMTDTSTWSSSNTSVATAGSSGWIECISAGNAGITARFEVTSGFNAGCVPIIVIIAVGASIFVDPCAITISVSSPDNFLITTTPSMPRINGSASVRPSTASIQWQANIVYTAPSSSCSGGPNFDSPSVSGAGPSFSPDFGGFYGGALTMKATCESSKSASDTFPIGGRNPDKATIQAEIGDTALPFDSGDVKRIACQESGQRQFDPGGSGLPFFGGGGDVGIMQICFQRTAADLWNWKANIVSGKQILDSSLSFSRTMPEKVRTQMVRDKGPFPDATDFNNDQLRKEAIKRYNAGTALNDGYWEWNDVTKMWFANPQGGGDPNYVANVLGRDPSCP